MSSQTLVLCSMKSIICGNELTTGSCGRRGQRIMFPEMFLAGAAQPER